jgi:hypothetical protein
MLKKITAGILLLSMSALAHANYIVTDSEVDGSEMTGMEVTVTFADGSMDSGTWATTSMDGLIPNQEGYAGAASGQSWELSQAGWTEGNVDGTDILGIWTLMNDSAQAITGFSIDALAGGVAFDVVFGTEVTPDSEGGKEFVAFMGNTTPAPEYMGTIVSLSDQLNAAYDDLFGTLMVMFETGAELGANQSVNFWIDTDTVQVNAPSTIGVLLMGMFLAARISRKKG